MCEKGLRSSAGAGVLGFLFGRAALGNAEGLGKLGVVGVGAIPHDEFCQVRGVRTGDTASKLKRGNLLSARKVPLLRRSWNRSWNLSDNLREKLVCKSGVSTDRRFSSFHAFRENSVVIGLQNVSLSPASSSSSQISSSRLMCSRSPFHVDDVQGFLGDSPGFAASCVAMTLRNGIQDVWKE